MHPIVTFVIRADKQLAGCFSVLLSVNKRVEKTDFFSIVVINMWIFFEGQLPVPTNTFSNLHTFFFLLTWRKMLTLQFAGFPRFTIITSISAVIPQVSLLTAGPLIVFTH